MRMEKCTFRIGQLAKQLEVERFVIRFWEKEFHLKSERSEGGQRFYGQKDLETFKLIKQLLYEKGFTIAGAKNALKPKHKNPYVLASKKTTLEVAEHPQEAILPATTVKKLVALQKQLVKFKKMLA